MALNHPDLDTLFTAIADAIRVKNNTTAKIIADNFPDEILALEAGSGGIDTSDATATANDMANGITAYVNGNKITGNVPVNSNLQFTLGAGYNATVSATPAALALTLNNPTKTIVNTNRQYITIWGYRNTEGWYVGSQAYCPTISSYVSTFCDAYGNFTALVDGVRCVGTYTNIDGNAGFTSVLNRSWITLNPFCIPFSAGASSYNHIHMSQMNNYNGIAAAPDLVAIKLTE